MKIREYQLFMNKENRHPYLHIKTEFDYETNVFDNAYDICSLMVDKYNMHELFVEHTYVIGFDYSNRLLGIIELSHESDTQSSIPEKELFMSLLLMGANKFVLIHNHPNDIIEASANDRNISIKIKLGANILGLDFVDHIIVGYEEYLSMKKENII